MTTDEILDYLIEPMSRADWWDTDTPRVHAARLAMVKAELASLRAERDRLIGLLDARHVRLPTRAGEPMAWTTACAPVAKDSDPPTVTVVFPGGKETRVFSTQVLRNEVDANTAPAPDPAVSELLPCPFCGATPEVIGGDDVAWWYSVRCPTHACPSGPVNFKRREQAVAAWNRRAPRATPDLAAEAEEIVRLVLCDRPDMDAWMAVGARIEELGGPPGGVVRACTEWVESRLREIAGLAVTGEHTVVTLADEAASRLRADAAAPPAPASPSDRPSCDPIGSASSCGPVEGIDAVIISWPGGSREFRAVRKAPDP